MSDVNTNLRDRASAPASVSVDGQSVSEHSLQSQLAMTRFQMATRARSAHRMAGVSIIKLRPHGAVLPADNQR